MNKRTILFVYGSEPDPVLLERAVSLQGSGQYHVKFAYWQRGKGSDLYYPFAYLLAKKDFVPIRVPDPRGSLIRRVLFSLIFTLKLAYRIHQIQPDALYCVNINMCLSARIASVLWPFRCRSKVIYEFQDQYGDRLSGWLRLLYRWSVGRVVLTVLQSAAFDKFIAKNDLQSSMTPRMVVPLAPAGWDYQYQPDRERRQLTVGYYGNLRGRKILESLIEATAAVNRAGHEVVLKFAGTGEEADYIRQQAGQHDFVQFSGRFEYHSEYAGLFSAADVIFAVFPQSVVNFRYHIARRFAEAAASRLPIIVCAGTYMAEIVQRTGCGWTVREGSAEELEKLLLQLASDRSQLDLSGKVPPDFATEFKFETYEPDYLRAVAEAVSGERSASSAG